VTKEQFLQLAKAATEQVMATPDWIFNSAGIELRYTTQDGEVVAVGYERMEQERNDDDRRNDRAN
jgi:hypothetical protein